MSLLDSIRASLGSMGFVQLLLAFVALLAYSLALSAALTLAVRSGAAGMALLSAAGFAAATPQWMDGVVLMALAITGCGAFAGLVWLLSQMLGVGQARGLLAAEPDGSVRDEALAPVRAAPRVVPLAVHSS